MLWEANTTTGGRFHPQTCVSTVHGRHGLTSGSPSDSVHHSLPLYGTQQSTARGWRQQSALLRYAHDCARRLDTVPSPLKINTRILGINVLL